MFPCLAGIALALVEQAGPRELGQGASIAAPISNHVPEPAHSPTAQEEEEQRTAYTFKSGGRQDGMIIPDGGTVRRANGGEAAAAVARSIAYHKTARAALQAIENGDQLETATSENEEALSMWRSPSGMHATSGIARLKQKIEQDTERQRPPVVQPRKKMAGYARTDSSNSANPSSEPVNLKGLTGKDEMYEMNPVTSLPPWQPCVSGATYNEHYQKDLKDSLRDSETEIKDKTKQQCIDECNTQKEACIGYGFINSASPVDKSSCFILTKAKYPNGVKSRSDLQYWRDGSVYLKDMSTASNPVKDCSKEKFPPNVVPQSDIGVKVDATRATSAEIEGISQRANVLMAKEVAVLKARFRGNSTSNRTRAETLANIRAQAQVYVRERTEKLEVKKNAGTAVKMERSKKKRIADSLKARTAKERSSKTKEMEEERASKEKKTKADNAKKAAERAQKASPEGILAAAERDEKQQETKKLEDEKQIEKQTEYDAYVADAHAKELKRLAALNKNISIALNASKTGNATRSQLEMLEQEGIPYENSYEYADDMRLLANFADAAAS